MSLSFGSTTTTTTPSNPTTGTTFGNTTSNTNTLFGGSSQPATNTGFGSSNTTFGSTNTGFGGTNTGFGSTNTGFGSTNTGFGSTNTGFGSTNTGFGSTRNSLFGNTQTANKGFSFPSTQNTGTGFGTSSNLFSGTNTQANRDRQIWELLLQADEEARRQEALLLTNEEQYKPRNVWQALALLKAWWDPKSPYCRFKHYFYNAVAPHEVHLYQRPPNHDKKAWDEAQKKNPDPSRLVPALAIGFEDVEKRLQVQQQQAGAHNNALKAIEDKLNKIRGTDALATAKRLEECKRRQMEQTQRVIHLLKYVQVLRNKGLPITAEEESMQTILENIQEQLTLSEQFHGKLSQLWAQLQLVKESGRKYGKPDDIEGWSNVTSEDMKSITRILDEQQMGIQHTIDILEKDHKDVDRILEHYRR